jgi:Cu/Ag efflux pump CusA
LRERIKVLSGSSSAIVVRIFGPDLDKLSLKAAEVANALSGIEGGDLSVQKQNLVPRITLPSGPSPAASMA